MGEPRAVPAFSWRFLLVVLGIAGLLRLVLILFMGNTYYFADTGEYERAAQSILAGHGPGADVPRAPLFPVIMAIGFKLGGIGNYRAVRLVQLVLGLLLVVQAGRLGARIGGPRVGRLAMLGAALAPTLVFVTGLLYPTTLYALLLLTATIAAWDLSRAPKLLTGVWLGVLLALTALTDQIVIAPAAFLLVWVAWATVHAHGRRGALAAAATGLAFVLAALPWVRYNEARYGNSGFFFAKAQYVLHFARHDPSVNRARAIRDPEPFRPLPMDSLVRRELGFLSHQPAGYLGDYAREYVHFFDPWPDRLQTANTFTRREMLVIPALYIVPVLVFAVLGLFWGRARRRDRVLLVLVPLGTAFIYAFFITQTRYRIPVEPQLIALAALGVARFSPGLAAALTGRAGPEPVPAARVPAPGAVRN